MAESGGIVPTVYCRKYELSDPHRSGDPKKLPAPHQNQILSRLEAWYKRSGDTPRGTILVMPTGGGKTYTAIHFACRHPISDGYKVLWLAHTHHLLEQAFRTFHDIAPDLVSSRRQTLTTRVVSGTVGHFRITEIRPDDDIVIASLQSGAKAFQCDHPSLQKFIESADGKLLVVFDEAHHSPAPSYRRLLLGLRDLCPRMLLLGLTATPTYSDSRKIGWLPKLFPQELGCQVTPQQLMAAGVLAKPHLVQERTDFEPEFSDDEYDEWLRTNGNLPEDVVTRLANTKSRNEFICNYYAQHRAKFGKTILFADRWEQCEYLCECLKNRGVKAGAIYSHVAYLGTTPEERNKRTRSTNDEVVDRFQRNELDVLVNIQMATEGLDVPDVKTVFLTRQTTSQILLTQMVGRALRGAKFGGTSDAYIVAFIDDWKHRISWASYGPIIGEAVDDGEASERDQQPPNELISIDLIRRLAQQKDSGINVSTEPFISLLPVGWFFTTFEVAMPGTDDIDSRRQLVLVYEHEHESFNRFVESLCLASRNLEKFEDVNVQLIDVRNELEDWKQEFFSSSAEGIGASRSSDLLAIARHVAQNERAKPRFFRFEERDDHDLDLIATEHLAAELDRRQEDQKLETEFNRDDRFWRALYPNYLMFKSQYDAVCNRILHPPEKQITVVLDQQPPGTNEPTEEEKKAVKERDGYRCLCCGVDATGRLQVDHVNPRYKGGGHDLENLQTLCSNCNGLKNVEKISFRSSRTPLSYIPNVLPELIFPRDGDMDSVAGWEHSLRQCVNFFYKCSAVTTVKIGEQGKLSKNWTIELVPDVNPQWLKHHLKNLVSSIRNAVRTAGFSSVPDVITVTNDPRVEDRSDHVETDSTLIPTKHEPANKDSIYQHGKFGKAGDRDSQKTRPIKGAWDTFPTPVVSDDKTLDSDDTTLDDVVEAIRIVEGFDVQVLRNGRSVRGDLKRDISPYEFQRRANESWTIKQWLESRFFKNCPGLNDGEFDVHVMYGNQERCPPQTHLKSVRESY